MTIRKQTKLWMTKDKRKIRICDMDDTHLCNTIKMLTRFGSLSMLVKAMQALTGGLMYAESAPEMASMCAEREAGGLMDAAYENDYTHYCELWPFFMLEAERRGIELDFKDSMLLSTVECWKAGELVREPIS